MSSINGLQISPAVSATILTPAQKRFNTLLRQIDKARQTLAAWQEGLAAYRAAHAKVLVPLQHELLAGHREWVFALDALLDQRSWTKTERATLRDLVCGAAGELLDARGEDDELKAVFDKHSDIDFETEQREVMSAMKGLAQALTGLDLGDDDEVESQADLLHRVQQGLHERASAEEAQHSQASATRRKTAAQLRRDAAAQQTTQSVRDIYRKLASALHPDREADADQRREKTELMQRVNQAYTAGDLLALLELQLKIEQIDAQHLASASTDRLKHYNKVLAEQLTELKAEIDTVEMGFCMEFGLSPGAGLKPHKLGELLEQTRHHWQAELRELQRDQHMLADVPATKRWLKRQQQRLHESEFDFSPF